MLQLSPRTKKRTVPKRMGNKTHTKKKKLSGTKRSLVRYREREERRTGTLRVTEKPRGLDILGHHRKGKNEQRSSR